MPLTSCQSRMQQAQKVQKLITSPLIMQAIAMNIANTDQYVCNFACLYFPLAVLGAPGPFLQADIKSTKRPVEDYHGCAH